jgi:hypothetical protein
MSGLTVTEKEHWKERIGQRINTKIESIVASDTEFFEHIDREARQRAILSLGLAELHNEQEEIKRQREQFNQREVELTRAMLAKVRRVPVETIKETYYHSVHDHEVEAAISRRQDVYKDQLLVESEMGKQVLKLRQEEASVLDAIWLASSPKEARSLWQKVSELLGDEYSQLVKDALAIETA